MARTDPDNSNAPDSQKPKHDVVKKVIQVLDTPVVDLAKAFFREPAQACPPSGLEPNPRRNDLASAEPAPSAQSVFAPLVGVVVPRKLKANDGKEGEFKTDATFGDCVRESLRWAWRAGPEYVTARAATLVGAAAIPYGISFCAAKVVDSLVKIQAHEASPIDAYRWGIAGACVALGSMGLSFINSWASMHHQIKNKQEVMRDMRTALTRFTPEEHVSPETTQIVKRTLEAQWALQRFGDKAFEVIVPAISVVTAVAIVVPYSPFGAAALGFFAVPYLYHSWKRGHDEIHQSNYLAEVYNRFGNREWGHLSGQSHLELKLYGKTREFLTHLEEERQRIDAAELVPAERQEGRARWVQPLNSLVVSGLALTALMDVVHGIQGAPHHLSIGSYGFFTGALFSLNASIQTLARTVGDTLSAFPKAQLALSVIRQGKQKGDDPVGVPAFLDAPGIEVKDLSFSYPSTDGSPPREILRDVNFRILPGELLGVVGKSGSGKSTLVNLLCGLYDPTKGDILFDDTNVRAIPKPNLWAASAYLLQQTSNLYSMTLRENICVGAPRPLTDDQILAIARETGFLKVMEKDGLTLDTPLGQWYEGGRQVSGGQASLLAMTRQAASGAKFLILDEPTSHIDQELVDSVLGRIQGLKGTTRIVIAHDYGIASKADRILVLNEGKVEDIGTHEELLKRCATYQTQFGRQAQRLAWTIEDAERARTKEAPAEGA